MTALLLQALLSYTLKATLLLLAALTVARLLRRATAARRHLIFGATFAALLLLPFAELALPDFRLPLPWLEARAAHPPTLGAVAVAATTAQAAPLPWGEALLLAWLAVALGGLSRLGRAHRRVATLCRDAEHLDDPRVLAQAEAIARELGLPTAPRLLLPSGQAAPCAAGLLRPALLLPADFAGWSAERRAMVLRHELGHLVRGDLWTQLLAQTASALLFFHPLLGALRRLESRDRERACDDLVLRGGARPSSYAALLIATAGLGRAEPHAVAALARPSELEQRLDAILATGTPRAAGSPRATVAVAAGALLAVATLALAEPERPSTSPAPAAKAEAANPAGPLAAVAQPTEALPAAAVAPGETRVTAAAPAAEAAAVAMPAPRAEVAPAESPAPFATPAEALEPAPSASPAGIAASAVEPADVVEPADPLESRDAPGLADTLEPAAALDAADIPGFTGVWTLVPIEGLEAFDHGC